MAFKVSLAGKKTVAIDWDARDLRLVHFRPRADGVDLLKAVSVPLAAGVNPSEAEGFGAFVREALRAARISAKHAFLDVPRDRIVLNTLSLPPAPPEELPSMVRFQVGKELPFATDQAALDFAVNGEYDPKTQSSVLVAAIRNEDLDYYRRVAHEAGLTIASLGLRPMANLAALGAGSPDGMTGQVLFVEVGPSMTEINVIRDGTLAFSRAASVSLLDLPQYASDAYQDSRITAKPVSDRAPDEATTSLVREVLVEVSRSFDAYRATDPGAGVTRVVVAGATGIEQELAQGLGARFGVRAELYSPESALRLSPQRARELRGFSAAIGSALNHNRKPIARVDFLNPKKAVSRRQMQLKKAPVAAAAAIVFIGVGVGFHWQFVKPLRDEAKTLLASANGLKKQADAVSEFQKKLVALEQWRESEQYWPDVLAAVTDAFPPEEEAFAESLTFETKAASAKSAARESFFMVNVRMVEKDAIHALRERMKGLGFENVNIKNTTPSAMRDSDYQYTSPIWGEVPKRAPSPEPKPGDAPAASAKTTGQEQGLQPTPQAATPELTRPTAESERAAPPSGAGARESGAPAAPPGAEPNGAARGPRSEQEKRESEGDSGDDGAAPQVPETPDEPEGGPGR